MRCVPIAARISVSCRRDHTLSQFVSDRPAMSVAPLRIQKKSGPPGPALPSLAIPSLAMPSPRARPGLPGLSLNVSMGGNRPQGIGAPDSPEDDEGGYYGRPVLDPNQTMQPVTMIHSGVGKDKTSIDDVKATIEGFSSMTLEDSSSKLPSSATSSNASSAVAQSSSSDDSDAKLIGSVGQRSFTDDDLEEVSRLGEGAGGAVHKVRDKRTGEILARKTIPTRTTPARQVLRELQFLKSSVHDNIIIFYGAYMTPSTSEVKVIMEVCEGRSLEAIGKKVIELNAASSEKVLGKLAEGVSSPHFPSILPHATWPLTRPLPNPDPTGPRVFVFKTDYPPRHQALQRAPHSPGTGQALRFRCLRHPRRVHCRDLHRHPSAFAAVSSCLSRLLTSHSLAVLHGTRTYSWTAIHNPLRCLEHRSHSARARPKAVPVSA